MFIVVNGHGDPAVIDAYLYDHAERIGTFTTNDGVRDRFVALVRTANDRYLTDYQAGRLGSGSYGAEVVYGTFDEASVTYRDWVAYHLRYHKPIEEAAGA